MLHDDIKNYGGLMVLEIGGEPLRYRHGYPNQLWIGGVNASSYRKEIREITAVTQDEVVDLHGDATPFLETPDVFIGFPNVAIAQLAEGQIIPVGQPHVFEGFAHAIGHNIKSIELSFDQGATWINNPIEDDDTARWVWWNYEWTPQTPGAYTIHARTTTEEGAVSAFPIEIMFNVK